MDPFVHDFLDVDGTRIHAVSCGQGPLVVLLHGFPESWYSWRFQLQALAEAGYRAVAIDQRGYGQSSKFALASEYRIHKLADDVVGVVKALGEARAVVIGHDWGAPVAWTCAWLYPEIFRGVIGMSVPFSGRGIVALPGSPFGDIRPDTIHRKIAGEGKDFYQTYFGAMDAVIKEIEADVSGWLRDAVYSLSNLGVAQMPAPPADMDPVEVIRASPVCISHGAKMSDALLTPETLPDWFNEQDLAFYANEFRRSGFMGPLYYYHNIDNDWEDLAQMQDKPLTPPSLFIGGDMDVVTFWGQEAIDRAEEHLTDYRGTHILQQCGHWIQQECPEQSNRIIIDFLKEI